MRYALIITVVGLIFSTCFLVSAQEEDARRIIIHPERYMPRPPMYEEPIPLDRTLKLVFKLNGPEVEKELTLLCATTVYGAETAKGEKDNFSIGGTLRMVRNTEVLVTFDFEVAAGEMVFAGNGSVKIKLDEEKVVFKYGDYTVSVHVELDSE